MNMLSLSGNPTNFSPLHKRYREIVVALEAINQNVKSIDGKLSAQSPTQNTTTININIAILVYVLVYLRQVLTTPGFKRQRFQKEVESQDIRDLIDGCQTLLNDYPGLADQFDMIITPLNSDEMSERIHRLALIESVKNSLNNVQITDKNLPPHLALRFRHYQREDDILPEELSSPIIPSESVSGRSE